MKSIFLKTSLYITTLLLGLSYYEYRKDYPRIKAFSNYKYKEVIKKLTIKSNNGNIYAEYLRPKSINGKLPLIICAHGLDSSTTFMKRLCGLSLVRSGFAVLVFDFCGGALNTKSDLSMNEMDINTEIEDLNAVIDYIKELEDIDTRNIYLLGESLGALVSAIVAKKREEEINGLILYYPAFSLPDTIKKHNNDKYELFGFKLSKSFFTTLIDRDVYKECGDFSKAVLLMHGTSDEKVNIEYARKAKDIYPNIRYIEYENEIHDFKAGGKAKAVEEVYDFIIKNNIL